MIYIYVMHVEDNILISNVYIRIYIYCSNHISSKISEEVSKTLSTLYYKLLLATSIAMHPCTTHTHTLTLRNSIL